MGRFNETVPCHQRFTYVLCAGFTQSAGERCFVHDIRPSCRASSASHYGPVLFSQCHRLLNPNPRHRGDFYCDRSTDNPYAAL